MKTQTIKHTLITGLITFFSISTIAQGYGEIRGIIKNEELEAVPFATIKILQGNLLVSGAQTDEKGRYSCKPLNPGLYEMIITQPEYKTQQINKLAVKANEATYVDWKLSVNSFSTIEVFAKPIDYTRTGVDISVFHQVSLNSTELNQTAGYNRGDVTGALEYMTSEIMTGSDGKVHFRGARDGTNGFFVDGVRTINSSNVPGLAIENISVFSGGIPAMYGDLSSGVVMVTTKSYFSGIRDKNAMIASERERVQEEKAKQKAKEEEENRLKEIEMEKASSKKEE